MNKKLILISLALAVMLSGAACKKLSVPNFFKKKTVEEQEVATETVAEPTPAGATASPAPPSDPSVAPPAAPVVDKNAQVVVLCYHRLEGKTGGALSIEPALFEEQMQRIKDAGLSVISMQDFLAWRRGEKSIPAKSVLITIDDGYVSGYEVGWPILKKYGYPFTMFVYLNYINSGGKSISWEQLAEMRDAGVEIGSHTVSHLDLRRKPGKVTTDYETWLKDEVERSKRTIEQQLGIKVATFAYPFGLHNEKVHTAIREAGYEAAFTTYGARLGISANPVSLGRYDVTTKDAQGRDSFSVAISFQGMMAPGGGAPVLAQEAAVSMVTQPMEGETITDPKPTIKANLATMGALDPGSVEMRISGLGLVPAQYDPAAKTVTYKVTQPLRDKNYTVILSAKSQGRKLETRWNFNFDPGGAPPQP